MSTQVASAATAVVSRRRAEVAVIVVGVALVALTLLREGAPAPVLSSSMLLVGAVLSAAAGLFVAARWSPLAVVVSLGLLVALLWTHGPPPQTLGDDWYWGYWNEGLGRPHEAWLSTLLPSVVVASIGPSGLTALNIPLALGTIAALAWLVRTVVPSMTVPGRAAATRSSSSCCSACRSFTARTTTRCTRWRCSPRHG